MLAQDLDAGTAVLLLALGLDLAEADVHPVDELVLESCLAHAPAVFSAHFLLLKRTVKRKET